MNWVSIDFGSSYSSAAVMIDCKPVKVHPLGGLYQLYGFPTVAYIMENKEIKVCNEALPWRCQNPERFVKDFKLSIHEGELTYLGVRYCDIVRSILTAIKLSAQTAINGEEIEAAVLTYPSSYINTDPRLDVMRSAASEAGFREVSLIKEAEAAAIYYDSIQRLQSGTTTMIYDLGGGTFDVSLVEHQQNGCRLLGTSSGTTCGGQQFESVIYRHLQQKYKFKYSCDESIRYMQIDAVSKLCKDIKEELSIKESASFPLPLVGKTVIELDRKTFDRLISPLLERTVQECNSLLNDCGKSWRDVDRIVMIGGSCEIPLVKTVLKKNLISHEASGVKILHNKSDEGVAIESLFAVSIGALISVMKGKNDQPLQTDSVLSTAEAYFTGRDKPLNWLKAAHCYRSAYLENASQDAFGRLMTIFQTIVDNLELIEGDLSLNPILPVIGEDAVDELIDMLTCLQEHLEDVGAAKFVEDVCDLDYWLELLKEMDNKR